MTRNENENRQFGCRKMETTLLLCDVAVKTNDFFFFFGRRNKTNDGDKERPKQVNSTKM